MATRKGKRMTAGRGWRLTTPKGRVFKGTLLGTMNFGRRRRLAIFSVPKRF
jgi:hypothetical protein